MLSSQTIDLAERIRAGARTKDIFIVGVSGIDCAGKSTLCAELARTLGDSGHNVHSLSIDDFCRSRGERNADPEPARGYYYNGFAYDDLFGRLLLPLRRDGSIDKVVRTIDFITDVERQDRFVISPPAIVLVEGVFLFQKRYRSVFDFKVWLEISFEEALRRAHARTRDLAYYKDPEAIDSRYKSRFFPGQLLHFELDRPQALADVVIPV